MQEQPGCSKAPLEYEGRLALDPRGSGSWRIRAGQHEDASERGAPPPQFFNDQVSNLPAGADRYGWKTISGGSDGGAECRGAGVSGSGSSGGNHS